MDNLVLNALPRCYRDQGEMQEIADSLTAGAAIALSTFLAYLETYKTDRLDPATALESWLDTLAYQAGWGEEWDSKWSVDVKRRLLADTNYLWQNRGTRHAVAHLFSVFALDASLLPTTGFILLSTAFPGSLADDPFSYTLRLNPNYTPGTSERSLIEKIIRMLLPCWITLDVTYS